MRINKMPSWTAVIVWMALIFYLSHQPATQSNELSSGITNFIVKAVENVAPNLDFDISGFNYLVRKNAHFIAYLILGVLTFNALRVSGGRGARSVVIALGICVLYAISDEVHQLFIPGRSGEVKDVLIDSAGASVGIGVSLVIARIINHRNTY